MTPRRALPLLLAAPALAARPALARSGYRWRVMRQGSEIGSHTVEFARRGEDLVATSDVSVTPTVLGIVVYRFEHRYTEVTRAGRFVSVQSRLNRNGEVVEVEAEAGREAVRVRGPQGVLRLPPDAAPLSWWEPQRLGGAVPLFGTTTGTQPELRWQREALAGGGLRWRTSGEIEAVLEYDASGRWVGYSVLGDDGSTVSYAPA